MRSNGRVTRAWLGVYVQPVDATIAKTFDLENTRGALIGQVVKDGPADEAGLKQGDVILEFDGQEVVNSSQLPLLVSTQRPDQKKKMKIMRDGKFKNITVKLGEMPEETSASGPVTSSKADMGFKVETPSSDRLRYYGFSSGTEGVLVSSIDRDSEAFKKNIRVGHVIEKIGPNVRNLKTVKTSGEFEKILGAYEAGDSVLLLVRRDNDNTFFVALNVPE